MVMNKSQNLSTLGDQLLNSISAIEKYEASLNAKRERETVHVPSVGNVISSAYEQLRNASEYSEGALLQQRAIRRYFRRVLSFHTKSSTSDVANELVAELTQAEYLPNDYITKSDIAELSGNIKKYYESYWQLADMVEDSDRLSNFREWVLDVLAVRCEQTLSPKIRQSSFAHFAHTYLHDKIKTNKIQKAGERYSAEDLSIILYISIQRALLKSDNATIRTALVDIYKQDSSISKFETFNSKIDMLLDAKTTVNMTRVISKNGAPLRYIYTAFYAENAPLTAHSLKSPELLEQGLHRHVEQSYEDLNKRLNVGIVRSVAFLLITKGIVGFAVEVPYDLYIYSTILWMPFFVNLLFPAFFIAFSRLTLSSPVERNTTAIITHVTDILFDTGRNHPVKIPKDSTSTVFNTVYALVFLIVFGALSYILFLIHFNIVQGVIFFIFLSTATFLSFRLSRQIHEIEVVNTPQGSLSLLRDVVYMPFIYVGQQISYRYSQINIVATILDFLIELPLKTILRLTRQWTQFLNDKKDEMI